MDKKTPVFARYLAGSCGPNRASYLLVALGVLVTSLVAAPRAHAQAAPHLAIGELIPELAGSDNLREYWEIANLGDTPWNPNNFWLMRAAAEADTQQLFLRVQGVDPVPPGGVLLIEWGRPIAGVECATKGNVFCTGRDGFGTNDLFRETAVAVFAPTANNQAPTVADGTMLAYYFEGGDPGSIDRDLYAYDKAVQSKLWKDGDAVLVEGNQEAWAMALRMGPGPYPANHGRSAADYYPTLSNYPSLADTGLGATTPAAPAPNTMNRGGTPARPNYLHPGLPIPGQIAAGFFSVQTRAITASLVPNAPATGLQAVGLSADGAVGTSLFSNNAWSPWTAMAGVSGIDGVTLLDNPKRATRTLLLRAKADGALSFSTASGDRDKVFGTPAPLRMKAQGAPAGAVDPATGNEFYVAVEAGTGAIMMNVNENGKLRGWQPVPEITTNAPVAAHWSTDPAELNLVAWNGNQLVLIRMGADGKFGAPQNVGTAVSDHPAGVGPVVGWNPAAKRLEIFVLAGKAEKADVQHARVELTAAGEAKAGALAKVSSIGTNAPPAIAINPDSGQIRLLARGGGKEPGINPRTSAADPDPGDAQSGFVLETTFDGSAWSAPKRVGVGRLPGPSPKTPRFAASVAPVSVFDANTKKFQDFLIGEDAQLYSTAGQ